MLTTTSTTGAPGSSRADRSGGAVTDDGASTLDRTVDRHRLRGRSVRTAMIAAAIAAIGQSLGTLFIGRLAETPVWSNVALLAVCVIGAALLDTVGRVAWSAAVDLAEGRLRTDLLAVVMAQPLSALSEQAVGEILDRIDDDTHEIGSLLRMSGWRVVRLALLAGPLYLVAGFTWWPAWLLFPLTAGAVFVSIRTPLIRLGRLKVQEEEAWTDHAAAMEEGIAARNDLRTSLGQPYLVRRCAELAANVHARMYDVVRVEAQITRRAGLLVHGLLAIVAVGGFLLVSAGSATTAVLVTLFAVTVSFVGQIDQVAHHLPDVQAGFGALVRLRALMASVPEPSGGVEVPDELLSIEFRDLQFSYLEGSFALSGISLTIEAGTTCALVGRSGSGKSTLASLVSRAVEPPPGTVLLGGVDVVDIELHALRSSVGVVTQRTEIISGTLAENISMFAALDRARIVEAIGQLGLAAWVDGLPDGLDTMLGPAGVTLSAGEEQLVAFARLFVRDVAVVVLDEATARMDPVTEANVVAASDRLLAGRTGILVAHRLSTTERADHVAVLDGGRIVQHGRRSTLSSEPGPFRRLLDDADTDAHHLLAGRVAGEMNHRLNGRVAGEMNGEMNGMDDGMDARTGGRLGTAGSSPGVTTADPQEIGTRRRRGAAPPAIEIPPPPSLSTGVWSAARIRPEWGLFSVLMFLCAMLTGAYGAVTGWIWGHIVVGLDAGERPTELLVGLVIGFAAAPLLVSEAIRRYPRWWIEVMLRVRTSVLIGQTGQRRLPSTPPGEVVARAMDSDRYTRYVDRWIDFVNGLAIVVVVSILGGTVLAGAVLLAVMGCTAVMSSLGSPAAGRSAAAASTARATFGRSLVSALDSIRTVKLSAATSAVHRHLRQVDGGRVDAAVREHRVQSMLDGVPVVMVQAGVVAAWAIHVAGGWGLATALLVSGAVSGFEWFGRVAGSVITEAPGVRAWQQETSRLAGGSELMDLPQGVDLVTGTGPAVSAGTADRFDRLELCDFGAIHDDGTIGVHGVDLAVQRGELVLLLGRIGSGKSSMLAALAGLVHITGAVSWNGVVVQDPETFLRPGRIAYVAQVPRVLSGSFVDNIALDHRRGVPEAIEHARLERDIDEAGGSHAMVGHRGVRLSGGQVQRLALARALATDAEMLIADDVSSALDASTEIELWESMRASGRTVIGATTKRAALARADRVVVLVDGAVAAIGPWQQLAPEWGHLAG